MKRICVVKGRQGLLLSLIAPLLLAACLAAPAVQKAYILKPVAEQELTPGGLSTLNELILVMPVQIPAPLQQKGMVVEGDQETGDMRISHRWAGALDEQIAQTLSANLQTLLATANVAVFPGPRYSRCRYQVETELIQFSGNERQFTLQAVFSISDPQKRQLLSRRSFKHTEALAAGQQHGAYAASASIALGALSREIGRELLQLHASLSPIPRLKSP